MLDRITANVRRILDELPCSVGLVVAGKNRTVAELQAAIAGGAGIIGESYVQEAVAKRRAIGGTVQWHFIGHLQRNKASRAVELFDLIETVDSVSLASAIDRHAGAAGKVLPVLIEVNIAGERNKKGAMPEAVAPLATAISGLRSVRLTGLMTLGPALPAGECRPFFSDMRRLFESVDHLNLPNVEMKHLSMGMSGSYRVAMEEGATLVRIGASIFGG